MLLHKTLCRTIDLRCIGWRGFDVNPVRRAKVLEVFGNIFALIVRAHHSHAYAGVGIIIIELAYESSDDA